MTKVKEYQDYETFSNYMEEKYPRMFKGRRYGGFAVGEGWYHILDQLCERIYSNIMWKRRSRAYDLLFNRARARGKDSLIKFMSKGGKVQPWHITEAEESLANSPRPVTDPIKHIHVEQIKEKFGGLRFYYQGGDEEIHGMVSMAEIWAGNVCEECGERGTRRSGGWVRTLCDVHEAERNARIEEQCRKDGLEL